MEILLGSIIVALLALTGWLLYVRATTLARAAANDAYLRSQADQSARLESELEKARALAQDLDRRLNDANERIARQEEQLDAAEQRMTQELEKAQAISLEQLRAVERREHDLKQRLADVHSELSEKFKAMAADALAGNNQSFLALAKQTLAVEQQRATESLEARKLAVEQIVKPIAETLAKTDAKLAELEKGQASSNATIGEQMRQVIQANSALRDETKKLATALREPHVRGQYGEMQLRRVAELAGMTAYCDFTEQSHTINADGRAQRPDMIVNLPSGRCVVVDAKTNIRNYLDALQATTPEEAELCLDRFAKHVADQATALAKKKYWAQYDGSPEFVVMFVPGDQFIDAALSRQPELLDMAAQQKVLLASPSTLIGLLRAVAVGYKEERLARTAEELRSLGIEFHERAAVAMGHVAKLGGLLNKAVESYNDFAGSYERRLEPTLKKFEDAGAGSGKELPEVKVVVGTARVTQPLLIDDGGKR